MTIATNHLDIAESSVCFTFGNGIGGNQYNGISDVPEPVSVSWLAGGIVLLGGLYKRARRTKQA